MYLVDDTVGDQRDIELRAYQIDNALLKTQVQMLQKEAEAYEKSLETHGTLKVLLSGKSTAGSKASKSSKRSAMTNSSKFSGVTGMSYFSKVSAAS